MMLTKTLTPVHKKEGTAIKRYIYYLNENGTVGCARIDRIPYRIIMPEKPIDALAELEQAEIKNGKVRIIDESTGRVVSIGVMENKKT